METIIFSISIFLLTLIKFLGLETSPPAFYADEAAGATQVLCLKQTGQDFFGHHYPLFTPGLGGGYYTAPFLYGESLWTAIFGNSVSSFRAFSAFVTTLAIFFLWDWLRKRVNARAALFAALFASMIPWSFQLARLAWDPPLAPLFLMLGLWCLDLKSKRAWIYGALAFALAAYSYPPSRIQVAILLCVLPGFNLRQKLKIFGIFILANLPMVYQALVDPGFTARGKMLAITSSYPGNPYHDADFLGLAIGFVKQFFAHLSPEFLFIAGDHNLRHSAQTVGEIDLIEGFIFVAGAIYFAVQSVLLRKIKISSLYVFALVGIASGIIPAALTWESVPHSLRAIGTWPFVVILSALCLDTMLVRLEKHSLRLSQVTRYAVLGLCLAFAGYFMNSYFTDYPIRSEAWFIADAGAPLDTAYRKMLEEGAFCADLRGRR